MASHGTSPTPPPTAASQSYESSIQNVSIVGQSSQNVSVVGQSGPSYQPNIYHPHVYAPYYNQTPYSYNMQPSAQSPAPAGPTTLSFIPTATRQSEPSPIPMVAPSEERESPVPVKRGPGRPCKQPTGETTKSADTAARRPHAPTARKGRTTGSQNWSAQDLVALARFVEGAVPLGMNVWKRIEGLYNNEYAIPNNRRERGWDNMR